MSIPEVAIITPGSVESSILFLSFGTTLFYEHGNQGQLVNSGHTPETYDWYGGGLNLSHPITKKLNLSLNYRLTFRSSDANRDYTQNLVGLMLTYQLQ